MIDHMQEAIDTINELLDHGRSDEVIGLFILSIALVFFIYVFLIAFIRAMFEDEL